MKKYGFCVKIGFCVKEEAYKSCFIPRAMISLLKNNEVIIENYELLFPLKYNGSSLYFFTFRHISKIKDANLMS